MRITIKVDWGQPKGTADEFLEKGYLWWAWFTICHRIITPLFLIPYEAAVLILQAIGCLLMLFVPLVVFLTLPLSFLFIRYKQRKMIQQHLATKGGEDQEIQIW